MNFFEAQEDARKKTKWLGLGFSLSVLGVMVLVGLLISLLFSQTSELKSVAFPIEIFLGASLVTGLTILIPYSFKAMQLSRGGDVVAQDLGGRLLDPHPSDFHEKRLQNIVEEMALASGVPVPMVYVMDSENSVNAFAAGTEPSNAVIGVTRGCLERLDREELQGVIAHEFSHILNGDMKMNMRMIGWVFGLMAISMLGQILFRSLSYGRVSTNRDRNGGGNLVIILFILGIGLMVIGGVGVFFGRMLQAAISRQREYLADASAVQFTRNPDSIAGALMKIGGFTYGSKIEAPKAGEASHLFFADGGLFSFGLATHPPLNVRIKRIKKDWDGKFSESSLPPIEQARTTKRKAEGSTSSFTDSQDVAYAAAQTQSLNTPDTVDQLQLPKEAQGLSPTFIHAAHNSTDAQLLIFAMLIASEGGIHGLEAKKLSSLFSDNESVALVIAWSEELAALHSFHKICLIDLAVPALRRLSGPSQKRFIETTRELIIADHEVSLFEYMMQRVIERHLLRHKEGSSYSRVKYMQIKQIKPQVDTLTELMKVCENDRMSLEHNEIKTLDNALDTCEKASPKLKNIIIKQLKTLANSDRTLTSKEAELLRAIADAIGHNIPLGAFLEKD